MPNHGKQLSGRDAAAIAGGMVIGALGSRLLSPMIAMAAGTVRASLGGDPFTLLEEEHRTVLSLLDEMDESADSLARRGASLLKFKRALSKHTMAEEDVVYPLLQVQAGAAEAAKRLYMEHGEMKVYLYQLECALSSNGRWTEQVRSLRDLIRQHIRDEEEVEFPKLRKVLDDRTERALSGKIRREEALVL